MTPEEDLALRLAYVFLSTSWRRADLTDAAIASLGGEPAWLGGLVSRLLGSIRERPADRPYDLARVIMGQQVYLDGLDRDHHQDTVWRVRSFPVGGLVAETERMAVPDWPVPRLGTERALADLLRVDLPVLLWLADPRGYLRRADDGLQPYRYRWIRRPGRTPRLIEAPGPLLRYVQRRLLDRVLVGIPVHPAAYGFARGRNAVRAARRHVGSDWVINFDLVSFFNGIRESRVRGIVRVAGYPEPVARLMAAIMTTATPVRTLQRMPDDGPDDDRAVLRSVLRTAHLPQGAPTSPAIANLACYRLDVRLAGLAESLGLRYTRYADDLAFSGHGTRPGRRFFRLVTEIVTDDGYCLNDHKQRLQTRRGRQTVTGIVVNDRANLRRSEYDRLRAVLHDAMINGPEHANRNGYPAFREHLDGRIGWVEQLNPARGARLRRQFELITWPEDR
ncbi:hypothetical protein GCM10011575_26870 [Microlunatus endophyticus]|uniref:RNA-directed DNA polymerase n=1 Tax=Microlunatus endophyticus TaxID=1716077 RepID=A0A917W4L6_9ACTN|nr:reverse transcriptase family protein [Microlunatus endophyticus]GGL67020.1 hypothetical protein GCM10011575_26870 [Microlunatus endophyticus]